MILYSIQKKWKYISPLAAITPSKILKLGAKAFIKLQKHEVIGEKIPKRLVLFVTKKCNLRCKHCFYIPNTSKTEEMSFSEIQKISDSSKNNLNQVVFTGGEPFLRNDFTNIVFSFVKNGCKTINIITNGTLSQKVDSFLKSALEKTDAQFIFMLSLDGPPSLNDSIRGVKGSAEKTFKTLHILSKYYKKYPKRFGNIFVSTTINQFNIDHISETIAKIKSFKNIKHSFSFTRSANLHTFGVSENSLSGFDVDKDIVINTNEMKKVLNYLDKEAWNSNPSLFSLINRQVMVETIRILEDKPTSFTCLAGKSEIIIYPEGDVGICEMLKPVGNLKETDYDLVKFYGNYRKKFQDDKKCKCTHDCAILSSIKFSPESLVEIIKRNNV